MLQAVRDAGYTEPTPIQIAAIPLILAGHDIIGIAQTGTGKTAAFVLPILMKLAESRQTVPRHGELTANPQKHNVHRLRALVLAPTRELVVQIEENVRAYAKHVPLRIDAASFIRIGRTKAAVFPVPVCAMPMISCPAEMSGIAAIWIGVGSV